MPLDLNDPNDKAEFEKAVSAALKTEVEKAVASHTQELKSKNEELIGEKRKLQDTLKKFEGIDLDSVRALQEKLEKDEELRLLAEGKSDEVFNRRFERIKNDYESKLAQTAKERDEAKEAADKATAQARRTITEINLRREAEKAGVVSSAIDDVIRRGIDLFNIEEDGTLLQRDKDGKIVTIDGKNATPATWLEKLREEAPHFWPASSDAGRGGNAGGSGARTNLEEQMLKAASKGDMKLYREIRDKMRGIGEKK